MMKKFLTLLIPILTMMVCGTACDNQPDLNEPDLNFPSKTYFYGTDGKTAIEAILDKSFIAFYPENEDKLKSELSKAGLTITDIKDENFFSTDYKTLTEEASRILRNYRTATVTGDYHKAEAALPLTIGWSPYYKVTDKDDFMPGREIAPTICISAELKAGIDESELLKFAKKYNIIHVGEYTFLERWHTLIVTNDSHGSTLEIANKLMESGLCEYSLPDFIGIFGELCSL